jgi:hypothetical protein
MAWSISDQFPIWGESGESPPDGFFYEGGDQVNEKHLDYLWDSVYTLETEVGDALNQIDSNGDGIVDEADAARSASTNFDLAGNALTDTTQDYLDLTGGGNDVRVGTGQSIEDGSGNERLDLLGTQTILNDETDRTVLRSANGVFTEISAYSDQELLIKDQESGTTAVQYDTDPTAGVLRTPNAGVFVQETGVADGGEGVEIIYNQTNGEGTIQAVQRGAFDRKDLTLKGSNVRIEATTGAVDLSGASADLRLATGQSIEDGSGDNRLIFDSGATVLEDQTGNSNERVLLRGNTSLDIRTTNGLRISDLSGGFTAWEYKTSTSAPGTLELTDSVMDAKGNGTNATGIRINQKASAESLKLALENGNNAVSYLYNVSGEIYGEDSAGNTSTLT